MTGGLSPSILPTNFQSNFQFKMFLFSIVGLCLLLDGNFARPQQDGPHPPCPPGPGPCPPSHHHHGPPPLPFLRNVTRDEVGQFFRIATSENQTKAQIKSSLTNWAQQAGVSAAYANFTGRVQQMAQQFHDNVTSNLAGQALALFNQFWTIRQDDSITRSAECQQIRSAMNGTSPFLRHLVPMPPPSLPGPPPRGCFPPPPPPHHHGHGPHSHSHSGEGPGGNGPPMALDNNGIGEEGNEEM